MAEYIEREALRNSVESIDWYSVYKGKLTAGAPNTENALYKASSIYAVIDNAPSADVAQVQKWISVKDKLPDPEQEVLVCVRSKISNYNYICCAMYVPENWHRQSSDFCWDFECCDEYDEEQDDYIVKQGWYESIHNWDDYSVVGIEDIVTHWMPIPQPPKGE